MWYCLYAEEKGFIMNILLIGNGFDLAHGLPTKYDNFLEWVVGEVDYFNILIEQKSERVKDITEVRLDIPDNKDGKNSKYEEIEHQVELWECINNNFWLNYFLNCNMYQKENWIDFESEIANVIKSIESDMEDNNLGLNDSATILSNLYVVKFFHNRLLGEEVNEGQRTDIVSYKKIRDVLYKDLNRLSRAFEIYISEYVGKMEVKKYSYEIRNLWADYVLSFNYSHTYEKKYGIKKHNSTIKFDYIHGEAKSSNTIETNNMVLGIDEYLSEEKKNKKTDFIAFKKYYQRIYKATGSEYKNWVDEIRESGKSIDTKLKNEFPIQIPFKKYTNKHYLYIFGHSLDVTDKDILRDLILNDNVYTTIFYLNKDVMGQQIANLVKVIGQDELIRRTGGSTKTIEFKQQQDMVEK